MNEILRLVLGICVLVLGFPIGTLLAKNTKEELKIGRRYFRLVVVASLVLGVYGLFIRDDVFLFTGFFIAIVTSRSLK